MAEQQNKAPQPTPVLPTQYDVRITSLNPQGNILAHASVTINGCFAIRGIRIAEGSNGPFVSMPSYKNSKGEYRDICFPCTADARAELYTTILDKYQQAMDQTLSRAQGQRSAPNPLAPQFNH